MTKPTPDNDRRAAAYDVRVRAAALSRDRAYPQYAASPDELTYASSLLGSFTKGLPHNARTGLVSNPADYDAFRLAVTHPTPENIRAIPLGPPDGTAFASPIAQGCPVRGWEAMGAGSAFDLMGPDMQAIDMPPAPRLVSDELNLEMAELYWMALLRDAPLTLFSQLAGTATCAAAHPDYAALLDSAVASLNNLPFVTDCPEGLTPEEARRKRGPYFLHNVFRGTTRGDDVGPYISQFLLRGTSGFGDAERPQDGYIRYGAVRVDQRVRVVKKDVDFMTTWDAYLDVQNGAALNGKDDFEPGAQYRFIATPRDLCTYVHVDALFQSYLNAGLILLGSGVKFDKGIPYQEPDAVDKQQGFATFGGPRLLSLVTEVAQRALKCVVYNKYNLHRRVRPEGVGGIIDRFKCGVQDGGIGEVGQSLSEALADVLALVQNKHGSTLLPMAFPEGSPMHPSYGAGHSTVGGACVTVLKAFFDTDTELDVAFEATEDGSSLREVAVDGKLTVEGELNKLCSNISVGRDWAGVHYFSDYYESILLGEAFAIGMLEEQMGTFGEEFSMTVAKFDGTKHVISNKRA